MEYTNDYGMFRVLNGNRDIKQKHVDELKRSMETIGILDVPILVNEKFEVIDGQHRLEAIKQLGGTVPYTVKPGLGLKECIDMNNDQSPWDTTTYIASKAKIGIPQYVILKNMIDEYSDISASAVIRAFSKETNAQRLRHGEFKLADLGEGRKLLSIVRTIKKVLKKRAGTGVIAACRIMMREGADLDLLEDSINKNGIRYKDMNIGNTENAYAILCEIYNLNRKQRRQTVNKAIKDKAKYVVLAKAGTDHSEDYTAVIAWLLRLIYEIRANYWLWRVNRMSEGEIMKRYYELTRKEKGYAIGLSKGSERYIDY